MLPSHPLFLSSLKLGEGGEKKRELMGDTPMPPALRAGGARATRWGAGAKPLPGGVGGVSPHNRYFNSTSNPLSVRGSGGQGVMGQHPRARPCGQPVGECVGIRGLCLQTRRAMHVSRDGGSGAWPFVADRGVYVLTGSVPQTSLFFCDLLPRMAGGAGLGCGWGENYSVPLAAVAHALGFRVNV